MEDYLFDRETLGQFIDELIKKRPIPVEKAEELNGYREEQMRALDDYMSQALMSSLTRDQANELDNLLNQEKENPDVFRDFFKNQGIDVERVLSNAAESFSKQYLGGTQNV